MLPIFIFVFVSTLRFSSLAMPEEFQNYLVKEMKPELALMQSISKYVKNIDPKLNIPLPTLPDSFVGHDDVNIN